MCATPQTCQTALDVVHAFRGLEHPEISDDEDVRRPAENRFDEVVVSARVLLP